MNICPPRSAACVFHWLGRLALAGLLCLSWPSHSAPPPFVMASADKQPTALFKWYQRIYDEAFRRLGMRWEMVVYPALRIGAQLDQGLIDGEVIRTRVYGDVHPELIRVDESLFDTVFALYAANPALELKSLHDLPALHLRVYHRRGVVYCERALKSVLSPEQVSDVTDVEQGLNMLLAGRMDVFCDMEFQVRDLLDSAEFKGATGLRKVLVLGSEPLYPYLAHKHAQLAPRLAATLKAMKAEGLIECYRLESFTHSKPCPR
jgi:hypothetical protein